MTAQGVCAKKTSGENAFLKGTVILSLGGLIAKIVGAIYRIPLTGMIGAEGIGLYQTVFPVYTAMLTLSSTGLPIALSKIVSSKGEDSGILLKSLAFYGTVGFIFSLLMFVLGGFFGKLQGVDGIGICYKALAPSVFLVAIIACFRGYFQGKGNTSPTAVSQITEQIVKALAGLICCKYFGSTVLQKAFFAVVAVSISELAAVIYLSVRYLLYNSGKRDAPKEQIKSVKLKEILAVTVPVAVSSMAIPLGHIADSFIILNLLKKAGENAEGLFGLYSGCVPAVSGLPVAIAFAAAASAVPLLTKGDKYLPVIMRFTGFIAIPSALYLALFSREVISFLYGSLTPADLDTAAKLLTASSVEVILISFLQTLNACLIAKGKQKNAAIAMYIGLFVKIAVCFSSIYFLGFGIFGGVAGEIASLTVSCLFSFGFLKEKQNVPTLIYDIGKELLLSIICVLWGFYLNTMLNGTLWFIIISLSVAVCYLSFSIIFFGKRGLTLHRTQ